MRLLVVTQAVDSDHSALGFFVDWLHALAARCDEVQVICVSEGRHDLPANVYVHTIGNRKEAGMARRLFRYWRHLHALMARCDRVFLHMCPEYAVAGAPFFITARKPVILWYTHASVTRKLRIAEKIVDIICTATEQSLRLSTPKKRVMGHGIPVSRFGVERRSDTSSIRLLMVGRITPSKGVETAVRALSMLRRAGGKKFTLTLAGEGSRLEDSEYRKRLDEILKSEKLNDVIVFTGKVGYSEIPGLYARHDILVHDSRTGGLDKVVLEALASGIPVISSSPVNAFLTDDLRFPKGGPETLAEKTEALAGRLEHGEWNGEKWRMYVREKHGLDRLAAELLKMRI